VPHTLQVGAMMEYFSRLGYVCPINMSIADYCVDISSVDPRNPEVEAADQKRVDALVRPLVVQTK
jgi:hypothetical protein